MKLILPIAYLSSFICCTSTANSTVTLIQKLSEYTKFATISETSNYQEAANWLSSYIKEIGLKLTVISCNPKKPIIIGSWPGKNPSLESILINTHYDVVPANPSLWKTDPFVAELKEYKGEQVIFGRGTQDDKSLTIMQLEALRALKKGGFEPNRSIHISIVPGEEIGDVEGMDCLIDSKEFKALRVGAALDEGFPSQDSSYNVFYGERASWKVNVTANGDTGHASKFIENLAINKLQKFMRYADLFRAEEELRSKFTEIGKTTTLNLVRIGGGTANNVVPDTLWLMYGIRVSPSLGTEKMRKLLNLWTSRAKVSLELSNPIEPTISPHSSDSHFYNAILNTFKSLGVPTNSQIFPGATDSRKLRFKGIPSYGTTPCNKVEAKAHDHNEYIPVRCMQFGLVFYTNLIQSASNLEKL
jgi:N-acyl-L-amino-acid amidohydrolase